MRARQHAGEPPFDLIVMDIQMPRMDGLQAAAAIRELEAEIALADAEGGGGKQHRQRVPIVALTGLNGAEERAHCMVHMHANPSPSPKPMPNPDPNPKPMPNPDPNPNPNPNPNQVHMDGFLTKPITLSAASRTVTEHVHRWSLLPVDRLLPPRGDNQRTSPVGRQLRRNVSAPAAAQTVVGGGGGFGSCAGVTPPVDDQNGGGGGAATAATAAAANAAAANAATAAATAAAATAAAATATAAATAAAASEVPPAPVTSGNGNGRPGGRYASLLSESERVCTLVPSEIADLRGALTDSFGHSHGMLMTVLQAGSEIDLQVSILSPSSPHHLHIISHQLTSHPSLLTPHSFTPHPSPFTPSPGSPWRRRCSPSTCRAWPTRRTSTRAQRGS